MTGRGDAHNHQRKAPQLLMRRALAHLPEVPSPSKGWRLRQMTSEDMQKYVELMQANGELGDWDAERVGRMATQEGIPFAEISVIEDEARRFLSTACLAPAPTGNPPSTAQLGWVASDPGASGQGLGRIVCLAVMQRARGREFREIVVITDDWRLPAIALYLKLGFAPDYDSHPSYRARWKEILQRLKDFGAGRRPA
jgi:ribosomal protein S18 acetylase RimI-like enzyme